MLISNRKSTTIKTSKITIKLTEKNDEKMIDGSKCCFQLPPASINETSELQVVFIWTNPFCSQ